MTNSGDSSGCGGWRLRIKKIPNVQGRSEDGGGTEHMTSPEIFGIYALLALNLVVSIILVREAAIRILLAVQELDSNLARVIQNLGQELPAQLEGVNPIQMAIAQWIGAQVEARASTIDATITPVKGEGGLFSKKILGDS